MTIYIILVFILLFLALIIPKKNDLTYCVIAFIVLATISALRANSVGTDAAMYTRAFSWIYSYKLDIALNKTRYEIGFVILCKVLSIIWNNPQILLMISSIIINLFITEFIYKNSSNKRLSIILYVLLTTYFTYMNIIRQALAIAIILHFYEYLKKDKIKMYIIGIIIATLLHSSAIIMLIPIFIRNKKQYNLKYFLIVAVSFILAIVGKPVISFLLGIFTKYAGYMDLKYFNSNYFGAIISAFIVLVISTAYYFTVIKNSKANHENNLVFNNLILCMIFAFASIATNISSRLESYFYIFNIIAIPEILNKLGKQKIAYIFNKYFVILIGLLYCFIILKFRPEWDSVVPYLFFWEV